MLTRHGNVHRAVRFSAWLAAGLTCLAACPARADTLLRWKFSPGESSKYTMTIGMTQEMLVNDKTVKTTMHQNVDFTWAVGTVDADGSATMSQTMDRIRMEMKSGPEGGGLAAKYDSADENKPTDGIGAMFAQMMEPMIGKAMTMHITPRGEISDFKVAEGMLEGLKKAPGMQQMGGMFSEQGLKQMTTQAMLHFPEKEVAKGDSWTSSLEMPNPVLGNQKIESTYTYAGPDTVGGRSLETIDLKLNMTITPAKDSPTKVELKNQKSTGTIHFDNAQGRLADTESKMTMNMEITAAGMKIEAASEISTTFKRAADTGPASQPAEK